MIQIKTDAEIECMLQATQIAARVRDSVAEFIQPGLTTRQIDEYAADQIASRNAVSAFLGYRGFPGTICISVNDEVVHGIGGDRIVQEGDIVSIDCGVVFDGFIGDTARTVIVGEISDEVQRLIDVTKASLEAGIAKAVAGGFVSDISHAIESAVHGSGLTIVKEFVGHGVGRDLHEDPQIPNYGRPGQGPELKPGMTLAIEPMLNLGRPGVMTLDDGWTIVTRDGQPSAHFEHTVAVREDGPLIMTK